MNIRKILYAAGAAVVLAASAVAPVSAQILGNYIDNCKLVSSSQSDELNTLLEDIGDEYGCDVVIYTIDDSSISNTQQHADTLYHDIGSADDGIMLFVNIGTSQWAVTTSGSCIDTFTDAGLDYISEGFLPYLSKEKYYKAFSSFAEDCEQFLEKDENGSPYDSGNLPEKKKEFNFLKNALIALAIGIVMGLIVLFSLLGQLKSVAKKNSAADYQKAGSFKLRDSREIFLYKKTDRRTKPQNNSSGSSTHSSSSGGTHGGSSGSF